MPLRAARLTDQPAVEQLRQDFHALHQDVFAINDPDAHIEMVSWRARVSCRLREDSTPSAPVFATAEGCPSRTAHFADVGFVEAAVHHFESMTAGAQVPGPAIIESPVTSIVVDPGAIAERRATGSLVVRP